MTAAIAPTPTTPTLIGAYVPQIISLAKRGVLWAVLYGVFTRGMRGGCVTAIDSAATCYTATLDPSPLVWLAMAVVFVVSLGRASRATETAVVTRVLRRAATAMWLLPLFAAALGLATFLTADPAAWIHTTPPPSVTVQVTTE